MVKSLQSLFIALQVAFCLAGNACGQKLTGTVKSVPEKSPHIEWVKSWSSSTQRQQKKSLGEQFSSIVFGTRPLILSNPVAVVANSPDRFWILDQKNKALFQVKNEQGEVLHPFEKGNFNLSSLVGMCSGSNADIFFYRFTVKQSLLRFSRE